MEHSTLAAVRLVSVRRVLRGLSGQDQHPGDPDPSAPPDRGGATPRAGAAGDESGGAGVLWRAGCLELAQKLGRLAQWPFARDGRIERRCRARRTRGPTTRDLPGDAAAVIPRMVGAARQRRAGDERSAERRPRAGSVARSARRCRGNGRPGDDYASIARDLPPGRARSTARRASSCSLERIEHYNVARAID